MTENILCPDCEKITAVFNEQSGYLSCTNCGFQEPWYDAPGNLLPSHYDLSVTQLYVTVRLDKENVASISYIYPDGYKISANMPSVYKDLISYFKDHLRQKVTVIQIGIDREMKGCPVCGAQISYNGEKFCCSEIAEHFTITKPLYFYESLLLGRFQRKGVKVHSGSGKLVIEFKGEHYYVDIRKGDGDLVYAFPKGLLRFQNGRMYEFLQANMHPGVRLVVVNSQTSE